MSTPFKFRSKADSGNVCVFNCGELSLKILQLGYFCDSIYGTANKDSLVTNGCQIWLALSRVKQRWMIGMNCIFLVKKLNIHIITIFTLLIAKRLK